MIYVVGDTHGTQFIQKLYNLKQDHFLCSDDYLIICGDSCILSHENSKFELIQLYENLGTNILFVDGNHDNYDQLRNYPVKTWNGGCIHKISSNIFHLMRGQIFNICGKSFLTLGGADSLDLATKIENISWWKEEQISPQNIKDAIKKLATLDYSVDYVITHTCPDIFFKSIKEKLSSTDCNIPKHILKKLTETVSGQRLNELAQKIKYKKWFCGHWHYDINIDNKLFILFNHIELLE